MASVRSGIPRTISPGVIVGATDFREFSPQADWPSGITGYGGTAGNRDILDESGVGEGNVVAQNDATAHQGMGIDTFDDIVGVPFEVLARGFFDLAGASGDRMKFGVGPFEQAAGAFVGADFAVCHTFNSTLRIFGGTLLAPGQAAVQTSEIDEGDIGTGVYFWIRIRVEAIGLNARFRINFTFSAFNNPPAVPTVWDIDDISAGDDAALIVALDSRLGWIRSTIGPTTISDRRMSFISFSTDPTFAEPPPIPSEVFDQDTTIEPPTVIVDPLQDTWVGLTGSAFAPLV